MSSKGRAHGVGVVLETGNAINTETLTVGLDIANSRPPRESPASRRLVVPRGRAKEGHSRTSHRTCLLPIPGLNAAFSPLRGRTARPRRAITRAELRRVEATPELLLRWGGAQAAARRSHSRAQHAGSGAS